MRELTLMELELVSGGNRSEEGATELDEIIVVGDRGDRGDWGDWGDFGDRGDIGDYIDGGSGGGGDVAPPQELPDCVSDKPAITSEDAFMKAVEHLTNELRGLYNGVNGNPVIDASRYEYGVLIFEINGEIGYGNIQTNNNPGYVGITPANVPDGARIIAYMHNHPDQANIDDRVPSNHNGGDWDQYANLVTANLPRGITVDPNLLLVLYTTQDDKTRIYDKSDKNKTTPSCAV